MFRENIENIFHYFVAYVTREFLVKRKQLKLCIHVLWQLELAASKQDNDQQQPQRKDTVGIVVLKHCKLREGASCELQCPQGGFYAGVATPLEKKTYYKYQK